MRKNIMILLVGASLCISCQSKSVAVRQDVVVEKEYYLDTSINTSSKIYKVATNIPSSFCKVNFDSLKIINKMAYATAANFTKNKLYPCASCYLRNEVAGALMEAQNEARKMGLSIVVFDCYRPYSIQKLMFDFVKNADYVAHPGKGSKHNKGCAVDISLAHSDGTLLNMGTDFDDFTEEAHYSNTAFNSEERANRKLLRTIMQHAGFTAYDKEWWHFNYSNIDYKTENFIWPCP